MTIARRSAAWLADRRPLPTSLQAVCGYYADTGVVDLQSLILKRRVDTATDRMIDQAFADVEAALAEEFGRSSVSFDYDTKLVLPAKLTLGYLWRRVEGAQRAHAERLTQLAIEALIDGDMRDARNDAEYEDFEVSLPPAEVDPARVAAVAQETLQARVADRFDDFDPAVRELYDWAVDVSEAHQDSDEYFRELLARAQAGETEAIEAIRSEYKHAPFDDPPTVFTTEERELPYVKTQYDRVGVIYDGMVQMYRAAGFPIADAFHRSIVLAIVGAQLWLDDIDDYEADVAEDQLTPVTAEYQLASTERAAFTNVVDISEQYLSRARTQATQADSPLTGIATEYIYRSGNPETLPGAP